MDSSERPKKITLPGSIEVNFERGLVLIGANGSGKSRLGSWIDLSSPQKSIVHRVAAQKSLDVPASVATESVSMSLNKLMYGYGTPPPSDASGYKEGHRWRSRPVISMLNDYSDLLVYLLSEHNEVASKYLADSIKVSEKVLVPRTKIDKAKKIWEHILPHRELIIGGNDIRAKVKSAEEGEYNAAEMSDGERVIFYLIGQCLAAPRNGIIVIDEPELHLHKSIQYDLWNLIERERPDCAFIYLTHDVDFAASRSGFSKIWVRGFDGSNWELNAIDDLQEVPEELLLETYGSRKKILLVEGNNSSLDVQLYRSVFNDFLVKPCGSCVNVINYTKSLRDNAQIHHMDVYGLIDRDRRSDQEIKSLEDNGVYTLDVAEVENIFATPEILDIIASNLKLDTEGKLNEAVEYVFNEFSKELETQIANRVVEDLKNSLAKTDLSSSSRLAVLAKYKAEIAELNIEEVFDEVERQYRNIITEKDYRALLRIYNRKSIASRIGTFYGLKEKELPGYILRLAQDKEQIHILKKAIRNYIPKELPV